MGVKDLTLVEKIAIGVSALFLIMVGASFFTVFGEYWAFLP